MHMYFGETSPRAETQTRETSPGETRRAAVQCRAPAPASECRDVPRPQCQVPRPRRECRGRPAMAGANAERKALGIQQEYIWISISTGGVQPFPVEEGIRHSLREYICIEFSYTEFLLNTVQGIRHPTVDGVNHRNPQAVAEELRDERTNAYTF